MNLRQHQQTCLSQNQEKVQEFAEHLEKIFPTRQEKCQRNK